MKSGSYAIKDYEPRQDRKVAAVSNSSMCRRAAWVEPSPAVTDRMTESIEGARRFVKLNRRWLTLHRRRRIRMINRIGSLSR